jgi:hypothetical protein
MKFVMIAVVAQFSTQLTHYLIVEKKMGSIRASSLVTLLFIALSTPFNFEMNPTLHAVCLGASFVGMTDPKRLSTWHLGLASVAFSIVFSNLLHYLKGLGGALGSSAFISCLLIYVFSKKISEIIKS